MNEDQYLIVGLGNPGSKYSRTWHNCGFMTLEILSQRHHFNMRKIKFKGLYEQVNLFDKKVIFLKPQTYMNNSGESVKAVLDYYKIPIQNCLVIYDDIDIEIGKIRIRQWGSAGTHNGMRSIIKYLNSDRFPRIRIGIGPHPPYMDMIDYVMQNIPQNKQEELYEALNKAADAVEIFLKDDLDLAMNRLNGK